MRDHPITVKLVGTKSFEVEMLLMPDYTYQIRQHSYSFSYHDVSDNIQDYNTASYIFDLIAQELEGH